MKEALNRVSKGLATISLTSFKIYTGILKGPVALLNQLLQRSDCNVMTRMQWAYCIKAKHHGNLVTRQNFSTWQLHISPLPWS